MKLNLYLSVALNLITTDHSTLVILNLPNFIEEEGEKDKGGLEHLIHVHLNGLFLIVLIFNLIEWYISYATVFNKL